MSVRDRLEDAAALLEMGRYHGAFVQVLIAAAATSRKRYPQIEWDDNESFRNFIYDSLGVILNGPKFNVLFPFRGKDTPLEDIFYYHVRCELLHEGSMPNTIVFTTPEFQDGRSLDIVQLSDPLGIPIGWIRSLATAVYLAPENDELWKDESQKREEVRVKLGDLKHDVSFSRRPNQQSKKIKRRNERMEWTHNDTTYRLSYPPSVQPSQVADALEEKVQVLREAT